MGQNLPIHSLCILLSTSIRRLYDVAEVVKTSYRRWSDALCLQGTTKLVKKNNHRYTLERDEDYPNGAAFLPEKVNMKKKIGYKTFQ